MDIVINRLKADPREASVEFVECKCCGHPDTICDLVCENAGKALAAYYEKCFGNILHYNIDKALLVAGTAIPKWNGGKIVKPARLIIAGRATAKVGTRQVPVERIIKESARKTLSSFKRAKIDVKVMTAPGSANLAQIFSDKKRDLAVANDTSFGCAHYPATRLEVLVLAIRDFLYSANFRKRFPQVGDDIKIMALRDKNKKEVTLAIAFIDNFFSSVAEYAAVKNELELLLSKKFNVLLKINTLDDYESGVGGVYLTVTGLSCEMGDDGQVGRGNRYDGLITPNQPMSLEAIAGKNDNHPGRAYQVAAYKIAEAVVKKGGAKFASVQMLTDIGAPLRKPKVVAVSLIGEANNGKVKAGKVKAAVRSVMQNL
ncbi:S-adenosylmethionine synthase [Candidatus Woesearchaeota archaeon]|nr:S-adenosylmethionine synthase [Candidatus Woesearchaeota archaeon]